jgi:hypothetical protein
MCGGWWSHGNFVKTKKKKKKMGGKKEKWRGFWVGEGSLRSVDQHDGL